MPKHGSMLLYVHGNQKARWDGQPRTATSTLTQLLKSVSGGVVRFPLAFRLQFFLSLTGEDCVVVLYQVLMVMQSCGLCYVDAQTSGFLWDWELMYLQAYVYIIFVYRVVHVHTSTRSSHLNHFNLDSGDGGCFCSLCFCSLCCGRGRLS